MKRRIFIASVALVALTACSTVSVSEGSARTGYSVADALAEQLPADKRPSGALLIAPAFALGREGISSGFGQAMSDALASRLVHLGFKVVDARSKFPARRFGEPIAKSAMEQASAMGAVAVVLGSYSNDGANYSVNYRIVRVADSSVLASTDTVVRYGE